MLDYDGLGLRIPMLIVSAYAKNGRVSHVHYEHGSILKFVEDTFGLRPPRRERHARELARRRLQLQQAAASSQAVPSEHEINYFKHQPDDRRPRQRIK